MITSSIGRVRAMPALTIIAVIALFMTLFVATPARAAAGGEFVNLATQRCMDGSISQGVRLNTCNGGEYQDWTLRAAPGGSGNWQVYHAATGKCLDASISNGVRLNTCSSSDYQEWEWRIGDAGSAFLHIGTRTTNETQCLDGSISEGVRLNRCNNSEYQRWNGL